ncbi:MAG: portal protein [Massilioclostridium sp.]|nr:MAG: portal protein [Massilioclostridium sp.]
MFDKLKERVKNWMQKTGAETGLSKEFKDIFEVGGVPAFNQFYYFGIFIWKYLYKGFYSPWHRILSPTVADPYHKRDIERMDMAKAVCAELAGLIWSEQCEVHISQGKEKEQPLEEFVIDVLNQNGFWTKMQEHIEQVLALGGGAIKAWYEVNRDSNGNEIPGSGGIRLGFCMADQFVPTAWDNSQVTDGVFISREAKDGYYYTRLEWHKWDGTTYYISNEAFRSEYKEKVPGSTEPQDILGFRYPLNEIYPFINEQTALQGLTTSLFAYYRTAVANNIDDNSPLGVSIYANAMSTLKSLDICYDSFIREFELGKKRIIVPTQCLRTVVDPASGQTRRYFDATDEAYVALSTDDPNSLKIQDNTVELRVGEHEQAINAFLSVLCLQLGFSAGTFTFDKASGLKTATEVISENSKTYKTIKSHQFQVKSAITKIVDAIIEIAALYDLKWNGLSIRSLAAQGYETKVVFDDSILQDRQTNINEGITLVTNELMAKQTFMVKILGMTEAEARAELLKISQEKNITPDMYDQGEMESQEGTNLEEPEDEDNEKTEESEESIPGGEK